MVSSWTVEKMTVFWRDFGHYGLNDILQNSMASCGIACHLEERTTYWIVTCLHCSDVTMSSKAFQFTSISGVCSAVCSDAHQRKHQSSASLPFVDSPHKVPITQKMFPFYDVIMMMQMCTESIQWMLKYASCQWHICHCLVSPRFTETSPVTT